MACKRCGVARCAALRVCSSSGFAASGRMDLRQARTQCRWQGRSGALMRWNPPLAGRTRCMRCMCRAIRFQTGKDNEDNSTHPLPRVCAGAALLARWESMQGSAVRFVARCWFFIRSGIPSRRPAATSRAWKMARIFWPPRGDGGPRRAGNRHHHRGGHGFRRSLEFFGGFRLRRGSCRSLLGCGCRSSPCVAGFHGAMVVMMRRMPRFPAPCGFRSHETYHEAARTCGPRIGGLLRLSTGPVGVECSTMRLLGARFKPLAMR